MAFTVDGSNGLTFPDSTSMASATALGMRNRIINGAMLIDQRNAGAAVTVNTAARTYGLDRFFGFGQASDGVFTITQDSSVYPAGFTKSCKVTVTTADASVGASQLYIFAQSIEGSNITDLDWGSSTAKTVTLSFWVRSSLTGQFGGALNNSAANRSYPFSYTINSANTWEQKTITITGDTSGTWLTTTSVGINVWFDLGCGSTYVGASGAWAGAEYYGATGDTKLISTLNATWYITGVQLERGTQATPFEWRPFPVQLAMCQRYYEKSYEISVAPGSVTNANSVYWYNAQTGSSALLQVSYKVTKRSGPTITQYSPVTGTSGVVRNRSSGTDVTGYTMYAGDGAFVGGTNAAGAIAFYDFQWTASAEL